MSAGRPIIHAPTEETRELVIKHSRVGTPQLIIMQMLGIECPKTLRKYYREELDIAKHSANADIGGALYHKAMQGDTSAQIFWLKTRAGFSEKNGIDLTSSDGSMTPTFIFNPVGTDFESDI
jgi:hypothetical protein